MLADVLSAEGASGRTRRWACCAVVWAHLGALDALDEQKRSSDEDVDSGEVGAGYCCLAEQAAAEGGAGQEELEGAVALGCELAGGAEDDYCWTLLCSSRLGFQAEQDACVWPPSVVGVDVN